MKGRFVLLVILVGVSCTDDFERLQDRPVLRVPAGHGLSDFVPNGRRAGSVAYAQDLVFEFLGQHVDVEIVSGNSVRLARKPTSSRSIEELAESLTYEGLTESVARDGKIEARFDSAERAQTFARIGDGGFALGPFRIASVRRENGSTVVRLRSRGNTPVSAIDLIEVSSTEEGWRRLLGRDVDVVPALSERYNHQFTGVESVRLVELDVTAGLGILFNHRSSLGDVNSRRQILALLDSAAIADIACGANDCRVAPLWTDSRSAEVRHLEFRLAYLSSDEAARVTASVVRHQLGVQGHTATLDPISIGQMSRLARGDWDAAVVPLPIDALERTLSLFVSTSPRNITGWASDEFDQAVNRRDWSAAANIARENALFKTLVRLAESAVIDASWCGGDPKTSFDWRWLADLRPCSDSAVAASLTETLRSAE